MALGIAIVPMSVLGLVVLDIQRRGLATAEKELEVAVVDEAATTVEGALDQATDVSGRVTKIFADEKVDPAAREHLIGDVVARAPSISGVAFFDERGQFVDAVVPKEVIDDALRPPPQGGPGFRVLTLHDDDRALRFQAPLEGKVKGTVVVALDRAALRARLRDISMVRFSAPDRVYLVDESMHVLAGSPRSSTIFDASGSTARGFATAYVLTTEFRDDGVDMVGTVRTLPTQHWALVVERPTDEAFAALTSARRAFLTSVAVLAAFAALVGLVLVHRVLGPIAALMRLVRRYGRRELHARSEVKSGDELEALGGALEKMADDIKTSDDELSRRARIQANLERYLPAEAAKAAGEDGLALGGARKRATILFADVVSFTPFAEKTSPERAVAFLNELFTMLSEIVFRHEGMVDKFIGDCVMAVFDEPEGALAAAEDMHAFVASNMPRWKEAYAFEVQLGIGVSTGDVLMGNLGSEARMEYTVVGDAVNVAARLEALARPRQTLATKEVVDACPRVTFTSLGPHALRGKAQPVEVFEVAP